MESIFPEGSCITSVQDFLTTAGARAGRDPLPFNHWCMSLVNHKIFQCLTRSHNNIYNNINVVNLVGKLNNQLIIPKCGWFLGLAPSPNGMIPLPDCHKNHWGWGVSPAEMESTYRVMQLGIAQHCDMKLIWESTVFTHYCWLVIPIISIIHYIPYKSLSTTVTF